MLNIFSNKQKWVYHINLFTSTKEINFSISKKWNIAFFKPIGNVVKYFTVNIGKKHLESHNILTNNIKLLNKFITSQINLFTSTKEINFSISKYNTLYIKWKGLGLISLIEKLFNNISSTMLRGYVKSNSQYTLINSKTRNGTFGLKSWVSSHSGIIEKLNLSPFNYYLGFVKGKAIFGYLWAVPQLFSYCLRILKDKCAPGLEWALSNPPKPHAFTSLALQSSSSGDYLELVDPSLPAERTGRYQYWRRDRHRMSIQECLYHVEADIGYYEDRVKTEPNSHYLRNVTALKNEREGLRLLIPVQEPQPVVQSQPILPTQRVEQPQPVVQSQPILPTQGVEQPPEPVQRHPSGWTPINWNPSQQNLLAFLTTSRLTVSWFVRFIITTFIPFFGVITSLVLSVLIITNTPFISDIYAWLTSILGNDIWSCVNALFLVIVFLIKLLLMIRKANKSAVLYDRLFSFAANHYSSGILYFFILLLSVGLVYLCVLL